MGFEHPDRFFFLAIGKIAVPHGVSIDYGHHAFPDDFELIASHYFNAEDVREKVQPRSTGYRWLGPAKDCFFQRHVVFDFFDSEAKSHLAH